MATKYKHRHLEWYKGIKIDQKAQTKKDLFVKVEAQKRRIDSNLAPDNILLDDFICEYIDNYKKGNVSAEWYNTLHYMRKLIVDRLGDYPIKAYTPNMLQTFLNDLAKDTSASYLGKVHALVIQIFNHAYRQRLIPENIADFIIKPVGRKSKERRSITDEERAVLLKVIEGAWQELFIKLQLFCGLRPSEAQALTWGDIDFLNATISITKSYKRGGTVGPPKTANSTRLVPIPRHFLKTLAERKSKPYNLICTKADGTPIDENARTRGWKAIKRAMALEMGANTYRNKIIDSPLADDFVMYNLRHTFCTDLERKNVPINIASRIMGHSSISVTARIYTHPTVEAFELARKLIDG